jgi:hypothetical protein
LLAVPLLATLTACTGTDGGPTPAAAGQSPVGSSGAAGSMNGTSGASDSASGGGGSGNALGGAGNAGQSGSGGSGGTTGTSGTGGESGSAGSGGPSTLTDFSFFVTSMVAMIELSGNDHGFGGDLSYNGQSGVLGADEICKAIAERSMPGSGVKGWKAYLSTSTENAIDRISGGPWYDRAGRLVANDKEGLKSERPAGSDPAITEDLPNEDGIPNGLDAGPTCKTDDTCNNNHDMLTGSTAEGVFDANTNTCDDWTSTTAQGSVRVGHAYSAQSGRGWVMAHEAGGCARGISVRGGAPGSGTVGGFGGYGGFYCFAGMR